MSDTAPLTPMKRSLGVLLGLFIAVVAFGQIYIKTTTPNPPRWVGLAGPLMTAGLGLLWWAYPAITQLVPTWRRRVAIFFFVLAALELIVFFV